MIQESENAVACCMNMITIVIDQYKHIIAVNDTSSVMLQTVASLKEHN